MEQKDIDHLDIPTTVDIVQQETYHPPELNIKMSAEETFDNCYKSVPKNGRISTSVLPEDQPPPTSPERPGVNLSKEQLLPPTPGGYLENKIWTGLGSSKALAAAPAIVNKKTSGKDTMENGTIHA